ncbi:MAG: hypothetical protein OXG72_03075, partial [Acidobacteria bacterium]|nr:hypothetical protein [Acidobacteriota bacterium]
METEPLIGADWLAWATLVVPTVAVLVTAILNQRAHSGIARRIDAVDKRAGRRIEGVRDHLEQRIEGVRDHLGQRIEGVRDHLEQRIEGVRD